MAGALVCPSEWNRILATALRSLLRLTVLFGPLTLPILMRTEAVIAARGNAPAVGWVSSLCVFDTDLCISGHATCVVFVRQSELIQAHKMQVRGTVVFDSIAWIGPIAVSTLSACTLLQLEVSDPRLVSKPASRRMRRICEYLGYAYVLGVVGLLFFSISRARISQYWDSRESAFARWPQLTFADLVVKAIAFCLGPAGWML